MTQRRTSGGGRGRPSRLSRELADALLRDVRAGMPIELAADRQGVSKGLVLGWVRRGEARDGKPVPPVYRRFATRYRQARAYFHQTCLQVLLAPIFGEDGLVTPEQVACARIILARRFPEHWGPQRETLGFLRDRSDLEARGALADPTEGTAHEAVARNFGTVGPAPQER